jgi:hypothetical protein
MIRKVFGDDLVPLILGSCVAVVITAAAIVNSGVLRIADPSAPELPPNWYDAAFEAQGNAP